MSIDQRFSVAIAITAVAALGCRVAGLIVGTYLGGNGKLRRFLDILPACAMGAVLGPTLGTMTLVQSIALPVSVAVYLASSRFLLALSSGTAILVLADWFLATTW